MTKDGSTKIVNFMTPWARGLLLECIISLKFVFIIHRQYSKDDLGRVYQNSNFHDPRDRVICKSNSENTLYSLKKCNFQGFLFLCVIISILVT